MSKRKLFLNSMSSAAVLLANIMITFVMTPIMIHSLGNHDYGIWELLVGLVGYLGILEFGIGPALVRYVAEAHARDDRVALNGIFNTGAVALLVLGGIGLLVISAIAVWPDAVLPFPANEARALAPLLVLFGLNLAASLPRVALSAYLLGLQEHRKYNTMEIAMAVLQSVVVYHILVQGWHSPLKWLAVILLSRSLLESCVLLSWILIRDRQVRPQVSAFRVETLKMLVGYGVKNTVLLASGALLQKLVAFAIAYTAGVAHVVFFGVPNRLTEYVQSLTYGLGLPLIPYLTSVAGKDGHVSARQAWIQTARTLEAIALWATLIVIGAGEPFIRIWMGGEYADQSRIVLYILCVGLFARSVTPNSVALLMSMGRHGRIALLSALYAVVCFVLSIVLGRRWGIEGVALAVSLYSIGLSVSGLFLACQLLDIDVKDYLWDHVAPFSTPVALGATTFLLLREFGYPAGYASLTFHAASASFVYVATLWAFSFNRIEREFVTERLLRRPAIRLAQIAAAAAGNGKNR